MNFLGLLLRALGLLACGAVIVAAVHVAMPRPFEWRSWPACLGIAVLATVAIVTIAYGMMLLPYD